MEKWGSRELVPPMKVICEMGSIIHDSASRSRQSFSAALVHRRGGKNAEDFWPGISMSFPSLRCRRLFPPVAAWPRWVNRRSSVGSSALSDPIGHASHGGVGDLCASLLPQLSSERGRLKPNTRADLEKETKRTKKAGSGSIIGGILPTLPHRTRSPFSSPEARQPAI